MASIDKSKFQFVKRDDFASEVLQEEVNNCHVGNLDCYHFDEFYLPDVFKI